MSQDVLSHEPCYWLYPGDAMHRFSYFDTLAEDVLNPAMLEHLRAVGMTERQIFDTAREELACYSGFSISRWREEPNRPPRMPVYNSLTEVVTEEILPRLRTALLNSDYDGVDEWLEALNKIRPYL